MRRTEVGTEWRDGFLRFNTLLTQEITGDLQLVLGVDNVLDAREEDWPGFTGRHVYTGMSWKPSESDR